MDRITIERINLLHPIVRDEVLNAYIYINNKLLGKNIRLRFSSTFRTAEQQAELYAKGRTKPGKKVTNAKPWQSIHNYGFAIDFLILIDKDKNGTFESADWNTLSDNDNDGVADWKEITNYFKLLGWTWGGDWKSFPDYPHLEKTFGNSWRTLKSKLDNGHYTEELVYGKIYKWVNI